MLAADDDKGVRAIATAAARRPGLQLLVLFGSRARGDHAGTYADAFRRLADAGHLDADHAARLARAEGFRNVVAHAYERLDMARVHRAARDDPADLRRFLAVVRDRT